MSRETAIAKLVSAFRQYGYEGATLSRLSQATGLGRASLYHYFPSGKQEMAEAVLEYVNQWFQVTVLEPLHREGESTERLQRMCESLSQYYNRGQDACLLSVFSIGEPNDLFRDRVRQALNTWIAELEQVLADAGLPAKQARQRAEDAVMLVQGALVLSRGLGSTAPFERTVEQLPSKLLTESKLGDR